MKTIMVATCLLLFILSCKDKYTTTLTVEDRANLFGATWSDSCAAQCVPNGAKKDIVYTIHTSRLSKYELYPLTDLYKVINELCVIPKDSLDKFLFVHFYYIVGSDTSRRDYPINQLPVASIEDKAYLFFYSLNKEEKTYFEKDMPTGKKNITFSIRQQYSDEKKHIDNCAKFVKCCVLQDSSTYFANMNFFYSRQRLQINYALNDKILTGR